MVSKVQVLEVLKATGAVFETIEALSVAGKLITIETEDVETQWRRMQPSPEDQIFVVVFTSWQ